MTAAAALALLAWLWLTVAHGRFWQSGPMLAPAMPRAAPPVDIVVPARDEAESITAVLGSPDAPSSVSVTAATAGCQVAPPSAVFQGRCGVPA